MNAKQQQFEIIADMLESIATEPECDDVDARRRLLNACAARIREAAQGHARYEALRLRNPHTYAELIERNIAGEAFDDMVDELVKAKNEP